MSIGRWKQKTAPFIFLYVHHRQSNMFISDLPAQLTRFVGRVSELSEILDHLNEPHCRLLTVVGQGGIGKTRLSIEIVHHLVDQPASRPPHQFPDGVFFVPLAPIPSADAIAPTIARVLGYQLNNSGTFEEQLIHHLRGRKLLLVLDNFEHVMDGVDFVADLLNATQHLKILVTSRERLQLPDESVYSIQGMTLPDTEDIGKIEDYDALVLFQQIAEKVDWRFKITDALKPTVVRICQLVEGMPLAIELAAAWVRALSCETILQELERSFEILGDSLTHVPERHRSLRIVFEYSWNLLTETEREVFQRLSVFRGSFGREAAEQITGASIPSLLSLIDQSLLQHSANERYQIHELLRQYAADKLAQNPQDVQEIGDRHCTYYANFLEQFAGEFVVYDYDLPALKIIQTDLDNIYAMWDWAITHQRCDAIQRACETLYHYYRMWDAWGTGNAVFQKALDMVQSCNPSTEQQHLLAKILSMVSLFTYFSGLRELTDTLAQQGLDLARQFGMIITEARCLTVLGINAFENGNYPEARKYLEDSIETYSGFEETYEVQFAYLRLGYVYHRYNEYDLARENYRHVIATGKQRQVDGQMAWALGYLGGLETYLGNFEAGRQHCTRGLEIFERFGLPIGIFALSSILAESYTGLGQFDKARLYFHKAFVTHIKHGAQTNSLIMINLTRVAHLLASEGDITRSIELLSFILNNAGAWDGAKIRARQLSEELEAELPPVILESARELGKVLELKTLTQDFIKEFNPVKSVEPPQSQPITDQELSLLQQVTDSLESGHLLDGNLSETEQQSVNALLSKVDDILEREKSKMMATYIESAAHDLRTPLTVINTSLYLIDMISDPDKQKGRLNLIKEQVKHLQTLIENQIAMARLDKGADLDFKPIDLNQLMIAIEQTHLPTLTADRDLVIQIELADTPLMIKGDIDNLEQALLNIVENAVHYTPDAGNVTMTVFAQSNDAVIDIRDTGIGIPQDDLPHIFERFYRVNKARTERGRAGLGLSISQKIIEAHHGQILVDSTLDEGSVFQVILPRS